MKHLSYLSILSFAAVAISACAATYSPPKSVAPEVSQVIPGTKDQLLIAAEKVLRSEGLEIAATDIDSGVISTSATLTTVHPDSADCGTTMGISYLKEPRTMPRVFYEVAVGENNVSVRMQISAEYRSGCEVSLSVLPCNMTNLKLTCVSKGLLESQLLAKIALAAN